MKFFPRIRLYFHTLRYLRPRQITFRIYYALKRKWGKPANQLIAEYTVQENGRGKPLQMLPGIVHPRSYQRIEQRHEFFFLHLRHHFKDKIDWNFSDYGKLWTYNLNYFEYLNQAQLSTEEGLFLIRDFIEQTPVLKDGLEPFPTSLRLINWIKFLSDRQIQDKNINKSIAAQSICLVDYLEYHLLGNHLLENAYALLISACWTGEQIIFNQAEHLLRAELKEQILADGAHFERAPMYHQLMLYRLLDSINVLQHNARFSASEHLLAFLRDRAKLLLGWMRSMTFRNGDMPLVNDSAKGIAPTAAELVGYAKRLDLSADILPLGESGYRKMSNARWEILVDVGLIGPDYIPGHAHSDTLSFIVYMDEIPVIVDVGISTYEKNERRAWERSTAAHNTVQIDDYEQSQVWGGFRVAKRARPTIIQDHELEISASHDGYKNIGISHQRSWQLYSDRLCILDQVKDQGDHMATARLFLHPSQQPQQQSDQIVLSQATISFSPTESLTLKNYDFPLGYNKFAPAKFIELTFKDELTTWIKL